MFMSEAKYLFFSPVIFPHVCLTAAAKFRRESLFCPDELDSLFSYFDTGSGPRSKPLSILTIFSSRTVNLIQCSQATSSLSRIVDQMPESCVSVRDSCLFA